VVVSGRPASGKTTLSHALAHAIRCPLISRDEIKEGFVNTTKDSPIPDSDIAKHIYETFFETIEFLLDKRITLVVEAAFQHKVWIPKLEPMLKIARIRLIHCAINAQLAKSRFIERSLSDSERVNYHDDMTVPASKASIDRLIDNFEPPRMNVPTITVDTSAGYKPTLDAIVSFVRHPVLDRLQ
jgi:predicted kinase